MKSFIICALLVSIIGLAFCQQCSDPNEAYETCASACPITCQNRMDPPKMCTANCVIGCVCKEGYLRNASGQCVLTRNC